MKRSILITGSTDGIGFATAEMFVTQGHDVLLHGRSAEKLEAAQNMLSAKLCGGQLEVFQADLSNLDNVERLADEVRSRQSTLDVLVNNAGVFHTPSTSTPDGYDIRFMVNTFAPYLLTQKLLQSMSPDGRVVNLSSAAQSPVNIQALLGKESIAEDFTAYAQSKLALTMWSRHLASRLDANNPAVIAVNPGSMLGSKMVKDAFGVAGGDLGIGADVLVRASLSEEFDGANGLYFDNDSRQFASPHPDALNEGKTLEVVQAINSILTGRI
ncbi:MAG: SDR family NAD(P)-dependent oxidoreductase [Pseudomonadota bacterium]